MKATKIKAEKVIDNLFIDGYFHIKMWQIRKIIWIFCENIVTKITILYSVQAAAVKEGSSDSDSDFAFGVEPLHI